MANQESSRARAHDTSQDRCLSRTPNTLFPTARLASRPSLHLAPEQWTRAGEEWGSLSTARDYTDCSDQNEGFYVTEEEEMMSIVAVLAVASVTIMRFRQLRIDYQRLNPIVREGEVVIECDCAAGK